tara:strand:- start:344 stop:589 length:246 start_codon:yes stop_codon:yes gene_type:complete
MYVKFPKNRWKEIERAEKNDEEGNRIFNGLKAEYLEKYMPQPDADPHALDFEELNDPNLTIPGGEGKLKSTETSFYKDEMN